MMNPYCRPGHVTDLILAQVATAAEALNNDLVARTIDEVTAEVASLLARRYPHLGPKALEGPGAAPLVPAIIRWIVSALSAWRVVGAITSLMETEAASDNQWLPIQKQYERAWALLEALAAGKVKLGLEEAPAQTDPDREVPHAAVVTPPVHFDLSRF